jgi:hypothetical protein
VCRDRHRVGGHRCVLALEISKGNVQRIPEAIDLELFEPRGTECDREIVRLGTLDGHGPEVLWMCRAKCGDIYIRTWPVTLEQLEALLAVSTDGEDPQA